MMMLSHRTAFVVLSVLGTFLTSSNAGSGTEECGADITQNYQFFAIKFYSYCDTRLDNGATTALAGRHSDYFADCAAACVQQGILCGGFAYDRQSYYGTNNCYLLQAPVAPWQLGKQADQYLFDSAIVNNSSLPLTRRDCTTTGTGGVYNGMQLHCNQGMHFIPDGAAFNFEFASSLSDCVDLCRKYVYNGIRCEAVSWDPTMIHGYQNCRMLAAGYPTPVDDVALDSATLLGTEGLNNNGPSSISTGTSAPTATASGNIPSSIGNPTNHPLPLPNSGSPNTGLSVGGVVGVVVGVTGAVAAILIILFVWLLRHKLRQARLNNRDLTVRDAVHTMPDEIKTPTDNKKAAEIAQDEIQPVEKAPPPGYTTNDPSTVAIANFKKQ